MVEKSHTSGLWPTLYEPFRHMGERMADWLAPASEAAFDDDAYRITVELPGVEEKDINLEINDGVVTLRGEKRTQREEKGEKWFFSERQYGSFSRSFRLPPDANVDSVDAHLKDGILVITVPKTRSESMQRSKVQIRKD